MNWKRLRTCLFIELGYAALVFFTIPLFLFSSPNENRFPILSFIIDSHFVVLEPLFGLARLVLPEGTPFLDELLFPLAIVGNIFLYYFLFSMFSKIRKAWSKKKRETSKRSEPEEG